MAIENTVVIPVVTRREIERTSYIGIHTPRDNPNFTITALRERYVQDSDSTGSLFNKAGSQVERKLYTVANTSVVLQNGKELTVSELAEAVAKLIDRWAQEDKDNLAAIEAQQAASQ